MGEGGALNDDGKGTEGERKQREGKDREGEKGEEREESEECEEGEEDGPGSKTAQDSLGAVSGKCRNAEAVTANTVSHRIFDFSGRGMQ